MNDLQSTTFAGMNGFVWWTGVVEDINDPLKLGRLRVRILGFHTDNKVDIPTGTLQWAFPLMPITSASLSGIGETPFGPLNGTWVLGFFQDGQHAQQPVVLGTLTGDIDEEPNYNDGFSDPDKIYPRYNKDTDRGKYPVTTNVNPAALEELLTFSPNSWRINTRIRSIQKAWPFVTYAEPESEAQPEYAKNHVKESQSGHFDETDDTPGKERRHWMHRSGTFEEWYPDGTKVVRIVGDDFEISLKDRNLSVQGNLNITVQGDTTLITNGNVEQRVKGDYNLAVDGSIQFTTKNKFAVYADGAIEQHAGEDFATYAIGNHTQGAAGYINSAAIGNNYVDGAMVHLNLPGPGAPDTTDEIADRRTSIPSDLLFDMHPDDILEKLNVGTDITDRVAFKTGGTF